VEKHERKSDAAAKQGITRQSPCTRCGGLLELTASLPRRHDSPAYSIFRCGGCGFIDWVAQDVYKP
jgi:hypothetical protein